MNLIALEKAARELYAEGSDNNIEIDPLSEKDISCGEEGIWVRAWVHVSNEILAAHGIDNPEAP